MPTLTGKLEKYPARTSFYWYLGVLVAGTLILRHPWCSANPSAPITWMDALFTATSALCVTGLSVRSTPNDFSFLGQLSILALIQIGGVGIMTITSLILSQFTEQAGLRTQTVITETLGGLRRSPVRIIVRRVLILTALIEITGALCMLPQFMTALPFPTACYYSIFHSISAFCNAGFGLHDTSLSPYRADWSINLTIMVLIVSGGIGYPVLMDCLRCFRRYHWRFWPELSLNSKLMIIGSSTLIVGGAISFFLLEMDGILRGMTWQEKILVPLFHSVSCRTAGFNTIELKDLSVASLFITVVLMVIGAGACSTGGGVKVTTVSLLFLHAWTRFRNRKFIQLFRRTIPASAVDRAMASAMLFLTIAAVALTTLVVVEQSDRETGHEFIDFIFEVSSALGTVGLTTGLTTQLHDPGRLVLIILMFVGRLGPIGVFAALSGERREPGTRFASEEPLVG
jgi:trk system potassium uptake protein